MGRYMLYMAGVEANLAQFHECLKWFLEMIIALLETILHYGKSVGPKYDCTEEAR